MSGTIAGSATTSIFANSATLGGHCDIGDSVFIGGLSAVHQFGRVGSNAMIGGVSGVRGDVIPFGLANGDYAYLEGLNIVGMRRRKFTRERLHKVRAFYQRAVPRRRRVRRAARGLAGRARDRSGDRRNPRLPRHDAKRSLVLPKQTGGRPSLEA